MVGSNLLDGRYAEKPQFKVFLCEVLADRGEEVARVCADVLAERGKGADFDPHEVLQTALSRMDAHTAATGELHLSGLRRCNS